MPPHSGQSNGLFESSTGILMFISGSPFDSCVGERCSRLDLFDAVDWLEELDHELVEAHAEHSGGFLELFGSE